jgi:hypothetical protein
MKPASWLRRYKPWQASQLRWMMQDMGGVARQPEQDHRSHLRATLEWVCHAQDACRSTSHSGWVAGSWSFGSGWGPGSEDATGWLIETCVPAANYLAWPELEHRVRAMLEALIAQPDSLSVGRIHGLIAGHVQLGHTDSLAHAVHSGYLLKDVPMRSPVRHAAAGRALAILGNLAQDTMLLKAARSHLHETLARQTPCGWFGSGPVPLATSDLASILHSLIESARLLDDTRALQAARHAAQALRVQLRSDGWLAGAFDDGWMPAANHVCVAGLAQLAVSWLRLAQLDASAPWRDAAWRAVAWIKRCQRLEGETAMQRAALPCSAPVWSGANAFRFDVLGAKYFADALMMDMVGITIPPVVQKVEPA